MLYNVNSGVYRQFLSAVGGRREKQFGTVKDNRPLTERGAMHPSSVGC